MTGEYYQGLGVTLRGLLWLPGILACPVSEGIEGLTFGIDYTGFINTTKKCKVTYSITRITSTERSMSSK